MAEKNKFKCKVCGEEFSSEKGVHLHLKKHKMDLATYYTTYYPRKNLLTGDPLPFKNKEEYFAKDFTTKAQLIKWCFKEDKEVVKPYVLKKLKQRIQEKNLKKGPNHLELKIAGLPDIDVYKHLFGSYSEACSQAEVKPLYTKRVSPDFFEDNSKFEHLKIL